jgi:hypothetical protein
MAKFRTFCMAASLAALAAGCTSAPPKIDDVKQVGDGSYTITYSTVPGLLDARRQDKAAAVAVGKAGDFCHAKSLKIMVTGAAKNIVMFRCVAN